MSEKESSSEESSDNSDLFRERVVTSAILIAGLISAVATHVAFSFNTFSGVLPVVVLSFLLTIFVKVFFDEFTWKTPLFIGLMSFLTWFISGTIILQFL